MRTMRNLPLIFILLVGAMTPLAATLLFYFAPPSSNVARGEVLPPLSAPAEWNLGGGKWTLLAADEGGNCGAQCRRRLCQMRQLRLMLPGHYFRLRRAWLRADEAKETKETDAADENAEPLFASADCGEARAAAFAKDAAQIDIAEGVFVVRGNANALPPAADENARADYLYLIDPDGKYAMRFPPSLDSYAVRKDIARLLKISKGRRRIQ